MQSKQRVFVRLHETIPIQLEEKTETAEKIEKLLPSRHLDVQRALISNTLISQVIKSTGVGGAVVVLFGTEKDLLNVLEKKTIDETKLKVFGMEASDLILHPELKPQQKNSASIIISVGTVITSETFWIWEVALV